MQLAGERKSVQQKRSLVKVLADANKARRHSQNCVQDEVGSIRVFGYAVWCSQCPFQFMNMVNKLLGEYLDKFVLVFLDNVLIYSAKPQDHAEYLKKVLGSSGNISHVQRPINVR